MIEERLEGGSGKIEFITNASGENSVLGKLMDQRRDYPYIYMCICK